MKEQLHLVALLFESKVWNRYRLFFFLSHLSELECAFYDYFNQKVHCLIAFYFVLFDAISGYVCRMYLMESIFSLPSCYHSLD